MAGQIQYKFASLNLQQGDITIGKPTEKINQSPKLSKPPLTPGSIAEEAQPASKIFSFPFTLVGSGYTDIRNNEDLLKAAFFSGIQKFTKDDDRFMMAQIQEFEITEENPRGLVRGNISIVAHFPFWLSETLHPDERTPTSGVGYTINNAGNAPTRVKIEVTAPAGGISDNCQIENQSLGITTKYRGIISAGNKLEINNRVDNDDFEVLKNNVSDMANFEGDFITLQPGNNTVVFTGTAGAIVKFSWRDCWY